MAANKKPRKGYSSNRAAAIPPALRRMIRRLPAARPKRETLSLLFHMWVEVMIQSRGNAVICDHLAFAVNMVLVLAEHGTGREYMDVALLAIEDVHRAKLEGRATGVWAFRGPAIEQMCEAACLYDEQLRHASIDQIARADDDIARLHREHAYKRAVPLDEMTMRLGDTIFSEMVAHPGAPAVDVELADAHGVEVDLVHAMLDRYVASGKLHQQLKPNPFDSNAFIRLYTVSADHRRQPLLPPEAPTRRPDEAMTTISARAPRARPYSPATAGALLVAGAPSI